MSRRAVTSRLRFGEQRAAAPTPGGRVRREKEGELPVPRRLIRAFIAASLLAGSGAVLGAAEIADLKPMVRANSVLVGFHVSGAFDDEIEHAIATGLEVAFRYNVELKRTRAVWLDSRVAKRELRTTVTYDNLTKRYKLTREVDGKIDATAVVADVDAMRRFMTTFDSLPLFDLSDLEPNEAYYVRVKGVLRERNLLLLIPWDVGTDWKEARFNYVP
jgi:Domain of unknown function (DUF4390)